MGRGCERAARGLWEVGEDLKATARRRITAARDRGQHNKFPKSSSLLPSLPKSSGSGSGARRAAEGYTAAPRACACARSKLLARRERGRGVGSVSRAAPGLALLRRATPRYSAWNVQVVSTNRLHIHRVFEEEIRRPLRSARCACTRARVLCFPCKEWNWLEFISS